MSRKRGLGCLILAALLWIRLSISSGNGPDTGELKPPKPQHDRFNAQVDCEGFVKQRLLTPLTAIFPSIRKIVVSGNGAGPWMVSGYVDTQNIFGSMVRIRYICTVYYEGPVVYLESLDL